MLRRGVPLLCATALLPACDGCGPRPTPTTTEPPPSTITIVDAGRAPTAENPAKGTGWYPNIEAGRDGALHLAWVDADAGDVRYALTAPGGSTLSPGEDGQAVITVDSEGAVGSFLRLALAPGDAPVLSYARQDTGIFRFAWRPDDRARMGAAGANVDDAPFPQLTTSSTTGSPIALQAGFVGEELGFGDQLGRGHGLGVDATGRVAVAYYSADDRLRLARRPADVPAFASSSVGILEKRDLAAWARGSVRATSALLTLEDGTVVVAWPHDVATDARLKIAILRPGIDRAILVEDSRGRTVALDGLTPCLALRPDGLVDVVTHDRLEGVVWRRELDIASATFTPTRERLVDIEGVAVAAAAPTGFFVLSRVPGEAGGVFLYVIEGQPEARERRRVRLGAGGGQVDGWLDVAVRPDGRPAAVWFDAAVSGLKLYAP
jgi:hypothetical protein